ncbi:hypothetical protein BZG36_00098 [Bifiguratus adelaidae]|uniref:Dolichyl-diphosphooligosaccharide--protein glycosyltransferase subunit OST2 n=1 Tax=Bifiguratus adelaidae TaxID=1938954 RepID=A0A261Y8Z1_9FUNG|nr:hypothetical protein BZG36_00098 [Bifiguratus adelaidae]
MASTLDALAPVAKRLWTSYKSTPFQLQLVDAYLVYIMVTGIIQFLYLMVVGTYPYNAFLAGFISTVGSFVLAANLRIQANPQHDRVQDHITRKVRLGAMAFADFVVCNILLHLFVVHFLG